ncbi:protein SABRE isoform X1 [Amaranthus tricolor]|uniref:protein SABRE isoform X1 n=2 Tax=Amaranthus tricolor TaxID=29722 RepID=UPI00258F75D2|nr:protein SABRE isoform X1 [Amaranthus tricolor]
MSASPAKFLFRFLFVSIILWVVFIFFARLVAWALSRVVGASVGFRVGGWKCLRDVVVKFKKGPIESVSLGEIRVSLRQSLVKLGVGFLSRDPKLQVLICDLEVVTRTTKSNKGPTKGTQKSKTRKTRSAGRGKWMVIANVARFLSVSVTDLALKTPKATLEVKDLRVDISKNGNAKPSLFIKLLLSPITAQMGEQRISNDELSNNVDEGYMGASQSSIPLVDQPLSSLNCEELSLSCEFGHSREHGIIVKDLDVSCGEISINLTEELLQKRKPSSAVISDPSTVPMSDINSIMSTPMKEAPSSMTKLSTVLPEKASFSLPKLNVRFEHQGQGLSVENHIEGIKMKSVKSQSSEDGGESTRLDIQVDFSEIHLLRDCGTSLLEILRLNVGSSVYIPLQPALAVRAEIDVKLGGTQCNMILSRLEPWIRLYFAKKKQMVLKEETVTINRPISKKSKAIIMWTCTVSAPEMTIILYSLSGLPLYHGCSQSSHVFANNISNKGTAVHAEFGELNLHLADEYQECMKECLFGVETNSGCLLHVAKVSLDWDKKDADKLPEGDPKSTAALTVDVTGMGIYFTMRRVESLVVTALSLLGLFKKLSGAGKRTQVHRKHSSKSSGKGIRLVKLALERCSVNFCSDVGLESTLIEDPKRANYGSQGGRFMVTVSDDGTKRTANIFSTVSDKCKKLKYSVSLEILHLSVCLNKDKQSAQMELERARSIYQEHPDDHVVGAKVLLLDMQNAKLVRRSGSLKEIAVCSLFSATDISVRWEPDVHISLFELMLCLKLLVHNQKLKEANGNDSDVPPVVTHPEQGKEVLAELGYVDKQKKKKESVFAVDIEMLSLSAEAGDGVEVMVKVQSIFSENARIGVLLEGLILSFNGCRIFRSSRMQISRIPKILNDPDSTLITTWDWVIQGLDVHICMPYRLELRAIDDSVEDQLRALKLIMAAKKNLIFPFKKESSKPKKSGSSKFGSVKFCIRKLTADIEEEPMQGWLDEHYRLLKTEARELAVRLKFLEELVSYGDNSTGFTDPSYSTSSQTLNYNGVELDLQDASALRKLEEDIYKQSFQSYYKACQKLVASEGSGACREGFQAGFRSSRSRASLLSITATDLDLTLMKIEGGEAGMIEVVRRLDPVAKENDIPFSRLYGTNMILGTGTLVVQIRDYTYPILSATSGKCEGCLVLAQQATPFQPQMRQDVYVGKWRKVDLLRSASGTTPPMKTYLNLPLHFQNGEVSFGVGYEPVLTDISYAFTVALRRAHLSIRNPNPPPAPPKKEKSLPWWDEVRNYIHGHASLFFSETRFIVLATTDPYEKHEKLQLLTGFMEIHQSDGRIYTSIKDFKILTSSLENLAKSRGLKHPAGVSVPVIEAPAFTLEVNMDWECDSGTPLNHYLFALPNEGKLREKVFDPFRSTSLSLRFNFSLRPLPSEKPSQSSTVEGGVTQGASSSASVHDGEGGYPIIKLGAHDLAWIIKFWNLNYLPPYKLRTFSRWPRYGVPRIPRSGNLSLDRVMTEFMLRIDATPTCIKHMPLDSDDPAKGLTFKMSKLKFEMCNSRGRKKYTFESKREPLDLVYQGLDLHVPKVYLDREDCTSISKVVQMTRKNSQPASMDQGINERNNMSACMERPRDDGFLLSSDYFTIRKQSPKADPARLLAWQEAGRKNLEMTYVRSEFENGSDSDEHTRSDPSDDDGYNVVIADNCQRVFIYGLKLLWNIENRDAVWSWVGGLSKAFAPSKPSPSRQYAQRKLLEEKQRLAKIDNPEDTDLKPSSVGDAGNSSSPKQENSTSVSSPSHPAKTEAFSAISIANSVNMTDSEEEGTRHFMVNVIEPQFNLHSEEANGRFLLAAMSGRVLARSFHSVVQVGFQLIEQAVNSESIHNSEYGPEMTWKRMELSAMLEHVQAHVAPTDVDPGAGLQWLPKIRRSSPKVKRTGALLERVFTPCDMYFRYTRHKGGTPELKVKPLKELIFNSHNITASMTSRQFQVMLDVLTNLLFARPPKPRKSSLTYPSEDDDDIEEEADEVVPDGVEEVELAKIKLEHKEREKKLLLDDIMKLSLGNDASVDQVPEKEGELWIISCGRSTLVQRLKNELGYVRKSRKEASALLRIALQKAAELRLMEKEKNKSPSYAMRISVQINKVAWSMLVDGKAFAEAEINEMIYDFDRDYKDVGVARFTTKYLVVRNCLPNAKSDMLLSAWNPPPEWGRKVMLRVDAKQGPPKDGNSTLELFQVEIYPLKIHLTEAMYRMMWEYLFPEEEQDSQRRQEVWKVSTTAGLKRVKKASSSQEGSGSAVAKETEGLSRTSASGLSSTSASTHAESSQASKQSKPNAVVVPELRRTSSFDKTWEENIADSIANELVLQLHSSSSSYSKSGPLTEQQDESSKVKGKDPKQIKQGRASHEEKKVGKSNEDKRSRPRKMMEFHNIKISQVELLVTYEGSRFAVSDLRLLMDQFHRVEFTGTWRRLFSRVKKHIIWGVLKSVTGMQGKKFKDKAQNHREVVGPTIPDDLNLSDSDGGQTGKTDQYPVAFPKRPAEGAGDGFVTSIRGLFNTQRRKARKFVLRTMRGEGDSEYNGEWSESDSEFSPFARQLTITKAKKLIRRHTKKFRSRKGSIQQRDSLPSSPKETTIPESDSSDETSPYEDFREYEKQQQ